MDVDPIPLLTLVGALLLLGLVVTVELALTMVSRSEVRKLSEAGEQAAARVERLLREPNQMLLTALLLKSAALVGAGMALTQLFGAEVGTLHLALAWLVTFALAAMVQVAGKSLVAPRAQAIALQSAPIMVVVMQICWPVTALLRRVTTQLDSDPQREPEEYVWLSEQGLRLLIGVGDEDETILDSEKEMIESILEMDETIAREVMVPRIDIVALNVETPMSEALDVIIAAGHSRIPVYEENIDQIVGFLYAKDLLQCFKDNRMGRPIRELLRPVHFVPLSKKVNALLRENAKAAGAYRDGGRRIWWYVRSGDYRRYLRRDCRRHSR